MNKSNLEQSLDLYNRGVQSLQENQLEEAKTLFEKAIKINPNFFQAYYNIGNVLRDTGKISESISYYERCLKIKNDFLQAYYNLANSFKDLGKLDQAKSNYEKTLKINPKFLSAKENLSIIKELKELVSKVKPLKNIDKNLITYKKPFITNRSVDKDLLKELYKINSNEIKKLLIPDARFGNGKVSDFSLFDHKSEIIKKVKNDLLNIMEDALKLKIYPKETFFNILKKNSGVIPHAHSNKFDENLGYTNQKYSLVYYISVGDQNTDEPGILKLYEDKGHKNEILQILPSNGTIIIFPASQFHSASYNGNQDRVMIGVNFYTY